jgi:tetratricopeptide (TPR) repeat protein
MWERWSFRQRASYFREAPATSNANSPQEACAFTPDDSVARCLRSCVSTEALTSGPGTDRYASAHFNLGMILVEQGALDEAFSEFRAVIRLDPDDAVAYSCLP